MNYLYWYLGIGVVLWPGLIAFTWQGLDPKIRIWWVVFISLVSGTLIWPILLVAFLIFSHRASKKANAGFLCPMALRGTEDILAVVQLPTIPSRGQLLLLDDECYIICEVSYSVELVHQVKGKPGYSFQRIYLLVEKADGQTD